MKFDELEDYNNYFDIDGTPLTLCFNRKTIHYKNVKVVLDRLPYLINEVSGKIYFTTPAAFIINEHVDEALRQGKSEVRINQFGRFDRGKLNIAENTKFRYSLVEHFFIPGLLRDIPSDGFLTPVYFNPNVLVKFEYAEGYELQRQSATAGRIIRNDGYNIPYGINKNGNVIMWLGDIANLPERELMYLYSENVEPQYDLHSDFYRNQILDEWL